MSRELVAGPDDGPAPPFPIRIRGPIVKGFGRGSRELGIPTANIPISGLDIGGYTNIESGVYYGWAGLSLTTATADASEAPDASSMSQDLPGFAVHHASQMANTAVYPMVMSIGWNPYYKNEKRSVEVHIIHKFENDFYNALLNLSILGFIRHEKDYVSKEALVDDINVDIEVAKRSVERAGYQEHIKDPFLKTFQWAIDSKNT